MVKIAVAGGTGNVATEIMRAAIASQKHTVTIFTRKAPSTSTPGVNYKEVDYHDRSALTEALKGYDVCLSFFIVHQDTDNIAQKNLIHASIAAGVRRFAPSEWGIKNNSGVPPYANKDIIAAYLPSIPETQSPDPKLEYCLFQPSIFMDYFAHPSPLSPNLITWPFFIDFENRRAMVLDKGDQPIAVTAIADISNMLALALEDERPWPNVGGMRGARTCINEILALGKKLRGGEWQVEYVKGEDIENDVLNTSWVPQMSHPVIPDDNREKFSKDFVIMFFKGILRGCWNVSDEWNQQFPEYKFVGLEEYLTKAWEGKP
ncbi:NAD(P)-binding protein [Massarina eburnea CBS 473.64]|uniref:NAD(P)-binding protein n=1 Tax=Massarina eburnea CBS 473.64 TaxID=1395130 RepID=A0A6A6S5D9_9PLEO|nr:NAD(P)-binding protein [Massarina eburnea CBS 473.64]